MPASATGGRSATGSRRTSGASASSTREGMLAIARLGAAESLAAGITTTADYSFSGAAAAAADELGLRAIVYLEVFGGADDAEARFEGLRAGVEETELVRIGVSPHAPYTCTLDTYRWCLSLGIPVGTHLAESDGENEWLEHGTGPLSAARDVLVEPTGKRAVATLERRARPRAPLGALRRRSRPARSQCSPGPTSPSRTARARTPCSDAARRRSPRSATPGSGSGSAPTRPPRRRRSTRGRRCAPPSPRARALDRRPDALDAASALHLATLGAAAALGLEASSAASLPANAPTSPSSQLQEARTIPLKIQPSQLSSPGLPAASWRRSSTERPATAKE